MQPAAVHNRGMTTFAERLADVTENLSVRQMALRADVEYGRLVRQFKGEHAWSIDVVVALCETFNIRLSDAMHDVGWISRDMADQMDVPRSLRHYSDQDLLDEMQRRLEAGMKDRPMTIRPDRDG